MSATWDVGRLSVKLVGKGELLVEDVAIASG
jgi:hypothetical protein